MGQAKIKKQFVTIALVIINVAVFVGLSFIGNTEDAEFMFQMGAVFPSAIVEEGEWWRLLVATFMHFGFGHILTNMISLLVMGPYLEDAVGHVKYLVLYLFAGLGGSVVSLLHMLIMDDYAVAAGASGAIFGIVGGLLWVVLRHGGRYKTLNWKGLLFIVVINVYAGYTSGGVDNWGHIGGFIAGFILAMIFYRKKGKKIDFTQQNQYTY